MLSRTKVGFLIVAAVAIFFIMNQVIGSPSTDTLALTTDAQPARVSPADIPVLAANPELMVSRHEAGSMLEEDDGTETERLLGYLRWKHMDVPMVETTATESNRLMEYLHWKHHSGSDVVADLAESNRLMEYLRWKHNTGPVERTDGAESERLMEFLQWKHHAQPNIGPR